MYSKTAQFYDAIHSFKDYHTEAFLVQKLIRQHGNGGKRLLEGACGTGGHLKFFTDFQAEAFDLDPNMVDIARQNAPRAKVFVGDLADFELGQKYDVILCLFSSIGYVQTLERLQATLNNFKKHLAPNGVVLVEPWLTPQEFVVDPPAVHVREVMLRDIKVCRMHIPERRGNQSIIKFHYMIGTPQGIDVHQEEHVLGLFSPAEMQQAFQKAGLKAKFEAHAFMARGVWIAHHA
ncbi:class I SAM-dependent methyltransferase [Deinococcus misasensis]|uniref:class I SAM-dependent methyltransferase n=1 Tax=Deinococcus misasensis TaxID=392413 RepID=UPI000559203C|nr:class I SAM-dependent methyltransferase [Deinococcus misasensis]